MSVLAKISSTLKNDGYIICDALLDLIAPPRCMNCLTEGSYLCRKCREKIRFTGKQTCLVCHKPSARGLTCRRCQKDTRLYGLLSFGSYQSAWLRRGIGWLKFKSVAGVAPDLAYLLLPLLAQIAPISELCQEAVIVPIPLHPRRLRQRGFNQSEEIARHISSAVGIDNTSLLARRKYTWAQAKLPRELRGENMAGAFWRSGELSPGKKIVIILDDVTTSGSTLDEAARALELPRDIQVWGLTVARG
ncbi:MAG: double zinc ribbon domain-containing protein [Candidatus Andersenbacteria bacterium]|nr:double zinc ribbon domain-containing protein [bacterium]MDZ4225208.1 double zinc ribbon domain-containing protein [Candidatus Andersenbacteria bacterium]